MQVNLTSSEAKLAPPAGPLFSVSELEKRNAGTIRLLRDASLKPDMFVCDIGCGTGDVSFLAAQIVGERGLVVGIDRDARALTVAKERSASSGMKHVVFAEGDFGFKDFAALSLPAHVSITPSSSTPLLFDAIVGRRVLMYQKDPVDCLNKILTALKPGGLVVFQVCGMFQRCLLLMLLSILINLCLCSGVRCRVSKQHSRVVTAAQARVRVGCADSRARRGQSAHG